MYGSRSRRVGVGVWEVLGANQLQILVFWLLMMVDWEERHLSRSRSRRSQRRSRRNGDT